MHESRFGDEDERLMHLVPAPAVILLKRRVLSRPGAKSLSPSLSWPQPGLVHDSTIASPPNKGTSGEKDIMLVTIQWAASSFMLGFLCRAAHSFLYPMVLFTAQPNKGTSGEMVKEKYSAARGNNCWMAAESSSLELQTGLETWTGRR